MGNALELVSGYSELSKPHIQALLNVFLEYVLLKLPFFLVSKYSVMALKEKY